jgi:hypothetical protein
VREKPKGGVLQGVALSKGGTVAKEAKYASYSKKTAKNYGGQARSAAAKNMRKGY